MKTLTFLSIACAGFSLSAATQTSAPFDFDTKPVRAFVAPCAVGYSPTWVDGVEGAGATAAIYAVTCVGQEQPVTSLVYRADAGATGTYAFTPGSGLPETFRLVLSVEKDGAVLGALERDLAIGSYGSSLGTATVDSRTNAVQAVADATGAVPLVYDASWQPGAARVRFWWHYLSRGQNISGGEYREEIGTKEGAGVFSWTVPRRDGFDKVTMAFLDADGNEIGESLETAWFEKYVPPGLIIMIR